ncbi:MAG: hypothetical protein KIS62_15465 [Ramlibacter sp.]|nr:hypothetical protein [Ramlibacter sp.]
MRHLFSNTFINRVLHKSLFGTLMLTCTLLAGVALGQRAATAPQAARPVEWPTQWDGQPLRPLALSEVELRFSRQFPGAIARLTDGRQVVVLRQVEQPTRLLHPAADCYRALGYSVQTPQLEQDTHARLWRCFTARRGGQSQRVCERIEDAQGQAFTDTSAWYWAALWAQSPGPWQAITVARVL